MRTIDISWDTPAKMDEYLQATDVTCQMTAVVADLSPAADPEEFYRQHSVAGLRGLLYERHTSLEMTGRAERIRRGEKM